MRSSKAARDRRRDGEVEVTAAMLLSSLVMKISGLNLYEQVILRVTAGYPRAVSYWSATLLDDRLIRVHPARPALSDDSVLAR